MGIDDFLTKDPGGNRRRGNFFSWKEKKSAVIWLAIGAKINYAYQHTFPREDEIDVEENGMKKKKRILRFDRFISPDSDKINRDQHFREKKLPGAPMQTPPDLDPFLITREYLRSAIDRGVIAPDTVVFEFWDPKANQGMGGMIQWRAGYLSRHVDRGKVYWNVSIDSKLQYTFLVVDNEDLDAGVQIAQEGQGIGDGVRELMKQQIDSLGEDKGNPFKSPYAMKWSFNPNAGKPADMYSVYRFDRAEYTETIYKAIAEYEELPDVSKLVTPQPEDMTKIRASMQTSMRIELPLDMIFSTEKTDRMAVMRGEVRGGGGAVVAAPRSTATAVPATTGGVARPTGTAGVARPGAQAPQGGAPAPAAVQTPAPVAQAAAPGSSTPSTGIPSRRKKVEAAPPPPPPVETIPCDDCGHAMLATDTKCGGCGAVYEVEADPAAANTSVAAPQVGAHGVARPTGGNGGAVAAPAAAGAHRCFGCGSEMGNGNGERCGNCGMTDPDLGDDDIPF
jgi:hypothetical protein